MCSGEWRRKRRRRRREERKGICVSFPLSFSSATPSLFPRSTIHFPRVCLSRLIKEGETWTSPGSISHLLKPSNWLGSLLCHNGSTPGENNNSPMDIGVINTVAKLPRMLHLLWISWVLLHILIINNVTKLPRVLRLLWILRVLHT